MNESAEAQGEQSGEAASARVEAATSDSSAPGVAPGRVRHVEIPLSALIVLGLIVVGTILLLRAIDRTQQVVGLAALAAVLSAVLAPAVTFLQRIVGRTAATILLFLVVLIATAGATGAVLQQIRAEADALAEFAEEQIEEVDLGSGAALQRSGLDERLGDAAANWGTTAIIGDGDAAGIATRASELTIVIVLGVFFTLQSGTIVDVAVSRLDRRRRRRVRAMWTTGTAAAAAYLRRTMVVATISGLAAAALAAAFGLPAVALIGVWAALLSAVPLLGAVMGWLPIVVLAVIDTSGRTTTMAIALALLGVVGVNVLRARFVTAPVPPGAFVISMSIACGITAAGIPGAVAAMFAAVAVVTVIGRPCRDDVHADTGDADADDAGTGDAGARDADVGDADRRAAAASDDVAGDAGGDVEQPAEPDAVPISSAVLEELADRRGRERGCGVGATRRGGGSPLVLTLSRRTAAQITGFVILAFVVQLAITRVGPIFVWAVVGALIAVGLDRPVTWAQRRFGVRREVIVIASAMVAAGAVAALLATATGSIGSTRAMDEGIPEFVESLSGLPLLGDVVADSGMEEKIDRFQRDLPNLITRSPAAGQAFGIVGGGVVGAFWVVLAALSCLLDGPRLVAAIDRRVPARITRQTTRLARAGKLALGGYVAGAAVVAAMNGGLVLVLGLAFGVPVVALLALWAFSWNFIPQIGAIIGWAPLLILALLESPIRGLVCLSIFLVYQVVENNAIQPTIVGNAVDIGALAALGAALAGAALAGLIGAALAIPIAGVARALYIESRREDFPAVRSRSAGSEEHRVLP